MRNGVSNGIAFISICAAVNLYLYEFSSPFSIANNCLRKLQAKALQRLGKRRYSLGPLGLYSDARAARHRNHRRIVGGSIAINGNSIEAGRNGLPEQAIKEH